MLALAVRQVIRHPPEHISQLEIEVALGFEHRPTHQSVHPPGDNRSAYFEVERRPFYSELPDQQFLEIGLDSVVVGGAPGKASQ